MPYANIVLSDDKDKDENILRLEWSKNGSARIISVPLLNGYPEHNFLESAQAFWVDLSLEKIDLLIGQLKKVRTDVYFRVLDELPIGSIVFGIGSNGPWRKINNKEFSWQNLKNTSAVWPWKRLNASVTSLEVIYIPDVDLEKL